MSILGRSTFQITVTSARLPASLQHAALGVALLVVSLVGATLAIDRALSAPQLTYISNEFFYAHDLFWCPALAILLAGLALSPLPATLFMPRSGAAPMHVRAPALLLLAALLAVALGVLGAHQVLQDYPLSRDEFLARFDARIFRSGLFVAPLAEEWRRFAGALAWQNFVQPVAEHAALVSSYLPVNAALRALVGRWTDESLTSPLLAALAILSTFGVGRRLWPERRDAAIVAAVLLLTSSQLLVTAMTPYAMSAHLAFNMLWLWLFLRDARWSHAGAIIIALLASGLHQLVFHPLFAAPFVLELYSRKRLRLAFVYTLAYVIIGLFWINYWKIALALQHLTAPDPGTQAEAIGGAQFFLERITSLFVDYQWQSTPLMLKNSLRFIVWENPLLLPLAALSWRAIEQDRDHARALLAGIILTFSAMWLLMPYQGHGWGYRYLHGLIGNFALLAGFGWIGATNGATGRESAAMRAALCLSSAFSLLVLLPAHLESARALTEPYARTEATLRQSKTEVVVIDRIGMRYGIDFARNDPFLRERPVRLALDELSNADLAALCARYSVTLFDVTNGAALGVPLNEAELNAARASKNPDRRPPCATAFEVPPADK